ncbi:hypothetical protein Hanom_Chr12g01125221 [Helianthus anomalus]
MHLNLVNSFFFFFFYIYIYFVIKTNISFFPTLSYSNTLSSTSSPKSTFNKKIFT